MRRIILWASSTLTLLVLLFGYRTSTSSGTPTSLVSAAGGTVAAANGPASVGAAGSSGSTGSTGSTGSSTTAGSSAASGGAAARTVTGDSVPTRFGNVQVQITVVDGRLTASTVTRVPWSDRHDQQVNGRAVPILNEEAVTAQSASIDMVSGATYTSEGYTQSLQSAIDKAHL